MKTVQASLAVALASVFAFVAGGGQALASETVLVAAGSPVTYLANSSNPGIGTTWTAEAFAPSGWSTGSYGVGYEAAPPGATALIGTTVAAATNSIYTRALFTIADVASVNNLFLGADYDDGYVAWINGVEVFRSTQMAAGTPAWNTAAASHESSNGSSPNYGTLQNITATGLAALHNGTNVLAIGVWNAALPSSDLVLVPKLSMNVDSSVVRGPYLQIGTPTSITVRWRTSLAGDSCVRYGAAPGSLTSSACSGASTTEHIVNVPGLTPDTTYYYSVGTSTATLAGNTIDHYFLTSPTTGTSKPTRVWALGDSGTADANARAVRDAYYNYPGSGDTDLWLMLGDNAYDAGTDGEYQAAVFDTYPTMLQHSVLWPTLGNHDGATADSATQSGGYYDIFSLPAAGQAGGVVSGTEAYYSFDYGDIHFVCLESYETDRSVGGAMLTWLAADLADTSAQWIVAFFHHPPYSRGSHNSDVDTEMVEMRQNALPILEAGGVDLVLTGHSHSYERTWLLDGHYGLASSFTSMMKIDPGDGREDGTGSYIKSSGGPVAHEGAVYVVAGSSGQTEAGPLNHPAMYLSTRTLGSLVLDFDNARLNVSFLDDTGTAQDHFTIEKPAVSPVCGNGIVEAGEACDDGNIASGDGCSLDCQVDCAASLRTDCRVAAVSILTVTSGATPARNQVKWKWIRGPAVDLGDLGDPTTTAGYNLCFYPDSPGAGAPGSEVLLAPGSQWLALPGRGYSYRDLAASNGGVRDLRIGTGAAGKTKLLLRSEGANVPAGLLPATSYTVQLVDVQKNACWSSTFASGFRSPTLFKGRAVGP